MTPIQMAVLLVSGLVSAYLLRRLVRLLMSVPALAIVPSVSRRLSHWVHARDYTELEFVDADGAGEPWASQRRAALDRVASELRTRYPESSAWGHAIRDSFSDLRFTDANRVPFPFVRVAREQFNVCSVVTASHGPRLRDLDGNWTIDVGGSYGVNVAGFARYKEWIEKGWSVSKTSAPVLGPLHPVVAENIAMLRRVSHLDEVSFHMSGTEAVMAAVRWRASIPVAG